MAHLWNIDKDGQWTATLAGDALAFRDCVHVRRLAHPPETWVLVSAPQSDVRINGVPVPLGLAVLSDRDELRFPGTSPRFFSTESLAHEEPFPEAAGRGLCPRCKQSIALGSAAIRCPACGLWHHATGELPCWNYADTCAGCSQPTAADAGFRWTPEDL